MQPTLFDISRDGMGGCKILDPDFSTSVPENFNGSGAKRSEKLALPEVSEVDLVRHYTELTLQNHGVDTGSYPLGSCTMKYNPKCNDVCAELPGFKYAHPAQPAETMPGLWEMLYNLQQYIGELTGMDHVSLQPAAGAHGELTGLLMINKYLKANNQQRSVILIADSAHGTNPASAAMAGFTCRIVQTAENGLMDLDALNEALDDSVAALMLTNPSTLGLFEENIIEIAKAVHDNGSLLYYDGANLNALMGIVRPGDMGFDVVHINTHKTLSTPHGGGGPGAGPVGVKAFLKDYLPTPIIEQTETGFAPDYERPDSIGQVKTWFGHVDVLTRAYAYILTMGPDGLKAASLDAVLNANYLQAKLADLIPPVYDKYCMHECLLNADELPVSAYNMAKRLIDYGVHPPTLLGAGCVYFSEELESAMLIEPTETESKASLDFIIKAFRAVIEESFDNKGLVEQAPHTKRVSQILPSRKLEIFD